MGAAQMSRTGILIFFSTAALFAAGCEIEDADRCGGGFTYEDGSCVPVDTDTGADTDEPDASPDGGDGPSGLGETCSGDADCAGYEADYCLISYGETEGYCTVQGCAVDPDDCPDGYGCCDFTIGGVPNFCAEDGDLAELGDMCEGA